MNSFNVYGQATETIGSNTPVWLGTVKPIPVGAEVGALGKGSKLSAGIAGIYFPTTKSFTPISDLESGAAMLESANAFLYNDVYNADFAPQNVDCTGAIVMHHPEGLLIERVYPGITEEQIAILQKNIPGVLLVRG